MNELILIGGELPGWSVTGPGERAPAGGPVLGHLVGKLHGLVAPGGRVLVAGPHDAALLDALPDARITCLLRSQPDAALLAAGRAVRVLCGTVAKLPDVEQYDLVVALDGMDRLCSAEGPQLDWVESLRVLHRALRPGGTLLLAAENDLGVHRLVDRSAASASRADGSWQPVGEFDPARPGNPGRLVDGLSAEGLAVSWLGAAWPVPDAPTLVATPGALGTPTGALVAAVSGAVAAAYASRPVLSDPRRLAATAVRAGLGAEFAASWLVLAHRAPRSPRVPAMPQALLGDPVHADVQELTQDRDGRWVRRTTPTRQPAVTSGRVVRRPERLDGAVPTGRLLEELLLTACLRHDLPAARRLLTAYAGWLAGPAAGDAFATFDNVLLDGGTFAVLDGSRATIAPVAADVATVRALRRFAVLLITGGYAHPWPAATDADALTTVLAAAAGVELDDDLLDAAVDLEVELASAAGADPAALREQVRHPGVGTPILSPDSWRERADLHHRLQDQLADANARISWFAAQLDRRDNELRRARWQIAAFSGSPAYRAAKFGAAVARRIVRLLRRLR